LAGRDAAVERLHHPQGRRECDVVRRLHRAPSAAREERASELRETVVAEPAGPARGSARREQHELWAPEVTAEHVLAPETSVGESSTGRERQPARELAFR